MIDSETYRELQLRLGTEADLDAVVALFDEHYSSWLTSQDPGSAERLKEELAGIKDGSTILIVAVLKEQIVGAALAVYSRDFSKYEAGLGRASAYLSKNVVHQDFRESGIGRLLIRGRIEQLKKNNIEVVYSSHHADNIASAKALDSMGFEYVESYSDPKKRPSGSRMTTVRRLVLSESL